MQAIRGASFAGLQQQSQASAKANPAHHQQPPSLRQQQATARAHSSIPGSSHSAAGNSHLNPQAPSFTPPAQGTHPRTYVATNGQRNGREDEHALRQNEVHGARYPQTSFTAGGQAGGLVQPPRSPEAGVPSNWEGQVLQQLFITLHNFLWCYAPTSGNQLYSMIQPLVEAPSTGHLRTCFKSAMCMSRCSYTQYQPIALPLNTSQGLLRNQATC